MTPAEFQALRKKANIAQHGLGYTCWDGQLEIFATLVRNAALEEAAAEFAGAKTQSGEDIAAAIRNMKDNT